MKTLQSYKSIDPGNGDAQQIVRPETRSSAKQTLKVGATDLAEPPRLLLRN